MSVLLTCDPQIFEVERAVLRCRTNLINPELLCTGFLRLWGCVGVSYIANSPP